MQSTIARLMRLAAEIRDIENHETEAPRLLKEYLGFDTMGELEALKDEHKAEMESLETDFKESRDAREKAESKLDQYLTDDGIQIHKLEKQVSTLQNQLKTLSERSDIPTAPRTADDATILAFTASLCEERARVRTLESQLAAALGDITGTKPAKPTAPPVKPLDTPPPGKAAPASPKARRGEKPKVPVPMATQPPTVQLNAERGGIELHFNGKPDDATRKAMKDRQWFWCPASPGQPWAHKHTEEEFLFAQHLATGSAFTPMPETPETAAPETPEPAVASCHPFAPAPTVAPAGRRRIVLPGF